MIIDSFETIDSALGLFGLFGGLEVVFVDSDELAIKTAGQELLRLMREVNGTD